MGLQSIRLGSTLTFDDEKEKDIIDAINKMNSCHKTGLFMSNLIRAAVDCPELLKRSSNGAISAEVLEQVGVSEKRKEFFGEISRKLDEVKVKADKIYDLAFKMYVSALMGKQLGLEERSKNTLATEFMLEQNISELKKVVGGPISTFESNKLKSVDNRAKECLAYIIETYSGIVEELKNSLVVQRVEVTSQTEPVVKAENIENIEKVEHVENVTEQTDELIDFGSDALSTFFGQ